MRIAICRVGKSGQSSRLDRIHQLDSWIVQFGDQVLLCAANSKWKKVTEQARQNGLHLEEYPDRVKEKDLYFVVQKGRLFQQEYQNVKVIVDKGRFLAVELSREEFAQIDSRKDPCFAIEPIKRNTVVFDARPALAGREGSIVWVESLIKRATLTSFESTLTQLVSYQTRYSTSSHYLEAATWCKDQLDDMGYFSRLEAILVGSSTSYNVIAEKKGNGDRRRELLLVVAHLDSVNTSGGPAANAPGADDNGSGSAALLEIAKTLQDHNSVHDLRFVLFGGEEQGLHGSQQYVSSLPTTERNRIKAVVNMDMVGTLNTETATVLLEGAPVSQKVINDLGDIASIYTSLSVQTSLNPYASDHVPFIEAGIPAVLTIEGADSANSFIHSANDTIIHINHELALEIIKLTTAYVATQIERKVENVIPSKTETSSLRNECSDQIITQLSGRYTFNSGGSSRAGMSLVEFEAMRTDAICRNPMYNLEQPVYVPSSGLEKRGDDIRFTLHIDIDGRDPLNVVSGTVIKELSEISSTPRHFIGRVTSNTFSGGIRNLIVEEFDFQWPGTMKVINCIEIILAGAGFGTPSAEVTFVAVGSSSRFGPYSISQESRYFREVEFEVDQEDGAVQNIEPYNTHTHPDRPSDLVEEELTLETTFAKSGIHVTRSPSSNIISTSEAGIDKCWNYQELHDAMDDHWSRFKNRPQWKMWLFMAELADSDNLGGVMFDGDINEPGGVDRQGTALFTKCPFFHTSGGDYIQANPPRPEAVKRELFFNLIHESGHAFNLAHSFQKTLGTPWDVPAWMPLQSDSKALSWMNYPDSASPGLNATWFYDRFRFRFDDNENLFLRHAPEQYVQMGSEAWFQHHGRVSRGSLDHRLEMIIRSNKTTIELGEPITLEIRLGNVSNESIIINPNLNPSDGFVEIAVTNPKGERRPFIPVTHTRRQVKGEVLEANQRAYQAVNLAVGRFGFPFKEPGPYRIEANYTNIDGGTTSAIMQLWVRPPVNYDDRRVISELFNARVGRVLYVGGSRVMEDVNDRLKWVSEHLGAQHPAQYHINKVRNSPLAHPFKLLQADASKVSLLDSDPEIVERRFTKMLENSEAVADTIGHIEFRQVVDTYTQCAIEVKKKTSARRAQENMLGLFKKRAVITPVIKAIEKRVKELK